MALTEKGKNAVYKIREFFPKGQFSAKDLSDACGEKIMAATLNGVVNNGYLNKFSGTPVTFQTTVDFNNLVEELVNEERSNCTNQNLRAAARAKDDEFYTRYEDIAAELIKYRRQFKDKVVYLPCDDPANKKSQFWAYLVDNFDNFGIKKLIATHYDANDRAYKIWIDSEQEGFDYASDEYALQEDLIGNGDFRSPECEEILKECDIVVTNPPFSLFSELVTLIRRYNKDFLLIGSDNKVTDKLIFPMFKENIITCGYNSVSTFIRPDGTKREFGNIHWYTTLKTSKYDNRLTLTEDYNPIAYPKYDNVEAINVDRVKNIPKNYEGWMGVPVSILQNVNFSTKQFEIIGILHSPQINYDEYNFGMPIINGKSKYARIIIKRINMED